MYRYQHQHHHPQQYQRQHWFGIKIIIHINIKIIKNCKADQKNEDRQFVGVDIRLTLLNERAPGKQSAVSTQIKTLDNQN